MDIQYPIVRCRDILNSVGKYASFGMALFFLGASTSYAAEPATVIVSCDGPDGYCAKGGSITVRTVSGGGVIIPRWVASTPLTLYLGVCDRTSDNYAYHCYGRSLRSSILDAGVTNGTTQWGSLVSLVDGTYNLPWAIAANTCVSVYVGQPGTQRFLSYGSTYDSSGYALCAGDAPPPVPDDYCYVTSGKDWDIAFGNLERGDISATSGSEKTKDLTLTCTGTKAHDFSIKLNMTPTSWSTSQLATSNPDLGVQVTVDGVTAKLGDSFAMKVTGSGSKTLGFSVLRNPATKALDIATGDFSASGTLVVSEL